MKKVIVTHVYQKPGAVFANALEAFFDKNSLLTDEIKQQIADTNALINERAVFSQPIQYSWDQDSFQLTIRRFVNDFDLFKSLLKVDGEAVDAISEQAGWTPVSRLTEFV
jgi:hypothetical protein